VIGVAKKGFRRRLIVWLLCWVAFFGGLIVGALEIIPALIIGFARDEFRMYLAPWVCSLPFKIERKA